MTVSWQKVSVVGLGLLAVAGIGWLLFAPRPSVPGNDGVTPSSSSAQITQPATSSTEGAEGMTPAAGSAAMGDHPATSAEPASERTRAEQLREALMALYGASPEQPGASGSASSPKAEGTNPVLDRTVQLVMGERFAPLIGGCYQRVLEEQPGASGHVVLELSLLNDPQLGAVVVDVRSGAGTTLAAPSFTPCVEDEFFGVVLDALPTNRRALSVTQSFDLSP